MAFDVICLLIFTFSVMEILLYKVSAHFLSRFVPIILANCFQFNVWRKSLALNGAGKCAITLHRCITVMDKVTINKQNLSLATGPLYVHIEYEVI